VAEAGEAGQQGLHLGTIVLIDGRDQPRLGLATWAEDGSSLSRVKTLVVEDHGSDG
jgi:hypothetical protein